MLAVSHLNVITFRKYEIWICLKWPRFPSCVSVQLCNTYTSDLKVDTCWDLLMCSVFRLNSYFKKYLPHSLPETQNLVSGSPDPPVVRGHGEGPAWSQAGRGLYSAQEGGCNERGPEGGGRDGCHAWTGGWLLHPIRGLQLGQNRSQVGRRSLKLSWSRFSVSADNVLWTPSGTWLTVCC